MTPSLPVLNIAPEVAHLPTAAVLEAIDQRHEPRRRELRAYQVRVILPQLPLDGRDAALIHGTRAVHRRAQLCSGIDAGELHERVIEAPAVDERSHARRQRREAVRRSRRSATGGAGEEGRQGAFSSGAAFGAGAAVGKQVGDVDVKDGRTAEGVAVKRGRRPSRLSLLTLRSQLPELSQRAKTWPLPTAPSASALWSLPLPH